MHLQDGVGGGGGSGVGPFPLQMMSKMVINQSMPNISIGLPRDNPTTGGDVTVSSDGSAKVLV